MAIGTKTSKGVNTERDRNGVRVRWPDGLQLPQTYLGARRKLDITTPAQCVGNYKRHSLTWPPRFFIARNITVTPSADVVQLDGDDCR